MTSRNRWAVAAGRRRFARRLGLALIALGTSAASPQPATPPPRATTRIALVLSQGGEAYREAEAGVRRQLARRGNVELAVVELDGNASTADPKLKAALAAKPGLIITLGSFATRETLRRTRDVPLVAGMVLSPDEMGEAANATGVFLQFSVKTELAWLAKVLPGSRRIGVLYHSDDNQARVAEANKLARGLGLTIEGVHVPTPEDIPKALEQLATRSDVLWGLIDPVVFTPTTAKALLLFSFRNRVPMMGPAAPWVRAGALFSLERDYDDIGVQCAEMAGRILDGAAPGAVPAEAPRRVRLAVNSNTAAQLRISVAADLIRDAAEVVR